MAHFLLVSILRILHNIIFASPSKSRVRNLQSIGRGLRLGENKVDATLYDIADDMTWKSKENFTLKHFSRENKHLHRRRI